MLQSLRPVYFFVCILLSFTILSCTKASAERDNTELPVTVRFNVDQETIYQGDEVRISPIFTPAVPHSSAAYRWDIKDTRIADIVVNADFSISVVGLATGTTEITLSEKNGKKMAAYTLTVLARTTPELPDDGIIKILTIGNSFSEDAVEQYLYGLAHAKGYKVVIGNLVIGGASLSLHLQNANNNAGTYSYRKINQQGVKTTTANTAIETALKNEDWDYISFQQASPNSGQFSTFSPLVDLYNYVHARATNPNVKYILHQTWAYAKNSSHSGFVNYGKDQDVMYSAIVDAYTQARNLIPVDRVIPAGTAIQNGRTSIIGDNFCRDGYHLDVNIGRYTASCTWFEAIFGESVVGNPFKPAALTAYEVEIAQQAAHLAVQTPNKVTIMSDYQGGGTSDFTKPILVNFGANSTSYEWNALAQFAANTTVSNLRDQVGASTNISITIVERFNGRNQNGPTATTTTMLMPSGVSSDSYYGNSKTIWEGSLVEKSVVRLSGLNKDKKYNLCFFGSRANSGNENRETKYTVKGSNEVVTLLDAANNSSNIACADLVQPNGDGQIDITLTAGSNNNNSYGFYYINALKLTQVNP